MSQQPDGQYSALPYAEVLAPRLWSWIMPVGFGACLGIAFGAAYTPTVGWLVGGLTAALLVTWVALVWRTRIEVDSQEVRADRARLPARYIGRVRPLDRDEAFAARTHQADPRAYNVLRTWATHTSVAFEVTDPQDPHPYWLVSTRRPEALADALVAARDAAGSG